MPELELLLFPGELPEYKASRGVKVPRKFIDPDSLMSAFWEPPAHIIERHGGIEQARAFRDTLLSVAVVDPVNWSPETADIMDGIEARNTALGERKAAVDGLAASDKARSKKNTHGKGDTDGKYEHDPVRPLRHDRSLSWIDDPLAA
jgi:hypothetical protein